MAILSPPQILNQLTAGGRYSGEDCGETCVVAALTAAGHPQPVRAIEDYDFSHEDNPADGTGLAVNMQGLVENGIPAAFRNGGVLNIARAAVDAEHWLQWPIYSDSYGNPYPGSKIGHWVIVYGYGDGFVQVANPLGGRHVRYAANLFAEASQGVGIELLMVMPADAGVGLMGSPLILMGV